MQPVRNENYANSNNERLHNLGVAARPAAPPAVAQAAAPAVAPAAPPMNNIDDEILQYILRESQTNVGANAIRRKGQEMHEAVVAARKLEKQRLNALEASRPAVSAPPAVSATPVANAVLNQKEEEMEWNNTYQYEEAQENNSNSSNENSTKPVAKNGGSRKNKRISRRKVKSMKKRNHRSRRNRSNAK
jgi:hypothetical protein